MYRLLAIDLDGTLLTPQKLITPRTYNTLRQAAEAGITIVIATGQTLSVLQNVCAELPLSVPQIIENGAIIADIHSGEILHEQLLPPEHILPVLATLRAFGLNRGNALRIIASDLAIKPEEIVAFGDNHNDIGMLRLAGLGVAMGNAHEEVKAVADYVTGSNTEEGVAAAIEELILPTLR